MKAQIKKVKDGRWFVSLSDRPVTAVFDDYSEALQSAYDEGADSIKVQYSNNVGRSFSREAMENFKMVGVTND